MFVYNTHLLRNKSAVVPCIFQSCYYYPLYKCNMGDVVMFSIRSSRPCRSLSSNIVRFHNYCGFLHWRKVKRAIGNPGHIQVQGFFKDGKIRHNFHALQKELNNFIGFFFICRPIKPVALRDV